MRHATIGFALAAALLVCAGGARAQQIELAPGLLEIREHRLENGLRILMLEDHSAPVISYQVWFDVGSRNERPGITGISHMLEHMMFRGSAKYGPEEHSDIVKAHGGSLNAFTSEDMTVYFENISSDQLELVIHLEAERLANLRLTDETFQPERSVVAEERRVGNDNNVFGAAWERAQAASYIAHPYQWSVVGWMSDIQGYTVEDVQAYYETYYAPDNATAVLVGDFDPERAVALFERYYGAIPAGAPRPEVRTVEPPQQGERRTTFRRPAQLPFLFATYHIPEASHADFAALEVAQKILSDGETSRIYRRCVYDEQLANFAGGFIAEQRDPGLFWAYVFVNEGVAIEDAERALFEEIEGLATTPPSENELRKAKNQLESDFVFGLQTAMGKGMAIGQSVILHDGDHLAFTRRLDETRGVTAADVARVVETYLVPDNRSVLTLQPVAPPAEEGGAR